VIPAEPNPDITLESVVSDLAVAGEIEINATTANLESKFFEHSKRSLELRGIGQDLSERKTYANRIFCLVVGWLICMVGLLLLQGFKPAGFHLSDTIITAAIGATTINVLGMLYVVANYLFPKKITIEDKGEASPEA